MLAASVLSLMAGYAQADPIEVGLERVLAADVSGSADGADFALQRARFAAAYRRPAVTSAIQAGAFGNIAVELRGFSDDVAAAVGWTPISGAACSNACAGLVEAAPRGGGGGSDGQSHLINQALLSLNWNDFSGTRSVLDIASQGAQDVDGCTYADINCPTVQAARDNFLTGGGTPINAIWLDDRDVSGLDVSRLSNAFDCGNLNVIGGPGAFQVFAADFTAFGPAIEDKLVREITLVAPEPGSLLLLDAGSVGLGRPAIAPIAVFALRCLPVSRVRCVTISAAAVAADGCRTAGTKARRAFGEETADRHHRRAGLSSALPVVGRAVASL